MLDILKNKCMSRETHACHFGISLLSCQLHKSKVNAR